MVYNQLAIVVLGTVRRLQRVEGEEYCLILNTKYPGNLCAQSIFVQRNA